ncbi:sensor histidine kinase [Acinetobacter silvestris]|uniref:ATP-binding protein n=1 Tax=Acinetobacter silvestris TaxID=1977882 RepID=A0A1Y3CFQ6_9GAMM|nr:sensor histidine kinase [Acinetobacter silvestris]OTG65940.1 ATP-binding protein [Acinetobacter silvestris]
MKKLDKKWFLKQKIAIRRELICKAREYNKSDTFNANISIVFPAVLSFQDKQSRSTLLRTIKLIRSKQNPSSDYNLYLDFNKVDTLYAPATIFFAHNLEQYQKVNIRSRASNKSNIVRAMMTKLDLHSKLGLAPCHSTHDMMNWHTFNGTDLTFGNDYTRIESILEKNLDDETFLIVNDAISEAVSNVLNHAYEKHQRYLGWKISLKVTKESLSLVITDLGKSIPVTVPDRLDDHMKNRLSNLFDFSNFLGMNDAELIDIASEFRRTSTKEKHRGKGFGDMLEVCKTVQNSKLIVYSKKGIWMSNGQDFKKLINYKDEIDGTIIFWKLPLNSPLTTQNLSSNEVGDGYE